MKVGITGSIGSGKSSVSEIIKSMGYPVFDNDKMVHDYYDKDGALYERVIDLLGTSILDDHLEINRSQISKIVFHDEKILKELEELVFEKIKEDMHNISNQKHFVFFEVPLLFEAGFENEFDRIVVVHTDEDIRLKRLLNKGMKKEDARLRMKRQLDPNVKLKKADYVIYNNLDLWALEDEVREFMNILLLERAKDIFDV